MIFDPKQYTKTVIAVSPASYTSTQTSSAIDTQGYEYVKIVALCGVLADTATLVVKVQDCATSGGSYVDITGATMTVTTSADDASVQIGIVRLHGKNRYIKVVGTYGGSSAVIYGVSVELYQPDYSAALVQTPDFEVL